MQSGSGTASGRSSASLTVAFMIVLLATVAFFVVNREECKNEAAAIEAVSGNNSPLHLRTVYLAPGVEEIPIPGDSTQMLVSLQPGRGLTTVPANHLNRGVIEHNKDNLPPAARAKPMLVPWPSDIQFGTRTLILSSPFIVEIPKNALLAASVRNFQQQTLRNFPMEINEEQAPTNGTDHGERQKKKKVTLTIAVAVLTTELGLESDETYSLSVPSEPGMAIQISAPEIWGAIRALQTLSQLISFNYDVKQHIIRHAPISITKDAPRFPHRGFLLDCSRHYIPVVVIERMIETMGAVKLNVLHLHMMDEQSIGFETPSWPKIWQTALSKSERYTTADISHLVQYARQHGIRVIKEFEGPSHGAQAVCKQYPEMCPETCTTAFDLFNPKVFQMFNDIIQDYHGRANEPAIITDKFIHMGNDETKYDCYGDDPKTKAEMAKRGLNSGIDAFCSFVEQQHNVSLRLGLIPITWEDAMIYCENKLSKDTVVHLWYSRERAADVMSKGFRVLMSAYGEWYLNYRERTWQEMYNVEPLEKLGSVPAEDLPLLLGGEVAQWGERFDSSLTMSIAWPRSAAVAEVLWSPRERSEAEFAVRIHWLRCWLLRRGISAGPLNVHSLDEELTQDHLDCEHI